MVVTLGLAASIAAPASALVPTTVAAGLVDTFSTHPAFGGSCSAPGAAQVVIDPIFVWVVTTTPCWLLVTHPSPYIFDNDCQGDPSGDFSCSFTLDDGTTGTLSLASDGAFEFLYIQDEYVEVATGTLVRV